MSVNCPVVYKKNGNAQLIDKLFIYWFIINLFEFSVGSVSCWLTNWQVDVQLFWLKREQIFKFGSISCCSYVAQEVCLSNPFFTHSTIAYKAYAKSQGFSCRGKQIVAFV